MTLRENNQNNVDQTLESAVSSAQLDGPSVKKSFETPDGKVHVAVKRASKAKLKDGVALQSEAASVTFPGEVASGVATDETVVISVVEHVTPSYLEGGTGYAIKN